MMIMMLMLIFQDHCKCDNLKFLFRPLHFRPQSSLIEEISKNKKWKIARGECQWPSQTKVADGPWQLQGLRKQTSRSSCNIGSSGSSSSGQCSSCSSGCSGSSSYIVSNSSRLVNVSNIRRAISSFRSI